MFLAGKCFDLQQALQRITELLGRPSKSEFISNLAVVLEEADETLFWLEMLADSRVIKPARLVALLQEANQLVAVFGASLRTAKANK